MEKAGKNTVPKAASAKKSDASPVKPTVAKPAAAQLTAVTALLGHVLESLRFKPPAKAVLPEAFIDDGTFVDPYYSADTANVVEKRDKMDIEFEAQRCCTQDAYLAGTPPTNGVFRSVWFPPLMTKSGSDVNMDSRGLLTRPIKATFTFKNLLDDIIKVRGNVPRALVRQNYQQTVALRDNNMSFDLAPRAQRTFTVRIDRSNNSMFQPLVYQNVAGEVVMALMDYLFIIPNISDESNTAYNAQRKCVAVQITVLYDCSPDIREGTTNIVRGGFGIQVLPSIASLFAIDPIAVSPPIVGAAIEPQFIIAPNIAGHVWMMMEQYTATGKAAKSYRLMYCQANGTAIEPVVFPIYQSDTTYRLIAPWNQDSVDSKTATAQNPSGAQEGSNVLMWDTNSEAWVIADGASPWLTSLLAPGVPQNPCIVPATAPFIIFSTSLQSESVVTHKTVGKQLLTVGGAVAGAIPLMFKIIQGETDFVRAKRRLPGSAF